MMSARIFTAMWWQPPTGAFYRRSRLAVLGAALTIALPAMAAAPQDSESYALAVGDRIAVTVLGQSELSGEMNVDSSGNIVLPFVGSVRVEDLTLLECQKLIQDRLGDGFLKQPLVSVRISEPRPLYVLGNVRVPGAYPFRYGITVDSAAALAGGFGAAGPSLSAAISEYLSADERVRELTSEQLALRIREARLLAQYNGSGTFSPPDVASPLNETEVAQLVTDEKATLSSQAAILKAQLDLLNEQKPRLNKEIAAITAQITTNQKRLAFISDEEIRSAQLIKQGLGVRGPEVQLKLEEQNEQSNIWSLTAQLSRSQLDLGDLDIKIQEAEASFKKQTLDELQRVRERLAYVKVALPSAREIRDVKLRQEESGTGTVYARRIDITRNRNGGVVVIKGSETTPLQPGDIVNIRTVLPDALLQLQTPAG